MIVVDTSALIAVFEDEPERRPFNSIIANADRRLVSTVNLLESYALAKGLGAPLLFKGNDFSHTDIVSAV